MKHYVLVNHHQIHLPGFRDLIKNLKRNENFVISHWGSKQFIDPKKSYYKSISLIGNFQKLDKNCNPLREPDHDLLDFWTKLPAPRIWISSMVDLHLGINQMLFGKNTFSELDGKQIVSDLFNGLAWAYEHNKFNLENKGEMDEMWSKFWISAATTHDFLIKKFENRLDFPWAVNPPSTNPNHKEKHYDFCIPGAEYPTRVRVEEQLGKYYKLAPYRQSDRIIRSAIDMSSRIFRPIRPKRVAIKKKLREINMNHHINLSNFTFVDGGPLNYFVRKYLEVVISGSTLICPPSHILKMYGLIENKHFLDANFFLQYPRDVSTTFTKFDLLPSFDLTFLLENHTFDARTLQLFSFLELLSNGYVGLGIFINGELVFQKK